MGIGGQRMNCVHAIGRLTKDPDIRYTNGKDGEQLCIARYTIAVDRRGKDAGADFVSCVAFGKSAEFAAKYLKKGTKLCITGRIQTGSYTNKDGQKVYTTDVVVEESEFCESKKDIQTQPEPAPEMDVPDGLEDDLPFA